MKNTVHADEEPNADMNSFYALVGYSPGGKRLSFADDLLLLCDGKNRSVQRLQRAIIFEGWKKFRCKRPSICQDTRKGTIGTQDSHLYLPDYVQRPVTLEKISPKLQVFLNCRLSTDKVFQSQISCRCNVVSKCDKRKIHQIQELVSLTVYYLFLFFQFFQRLQVHASMCRYVYMQDSYRDTSLLYTGP